MIKSFEKGKYVTVFILFFLFLKFKCFELNPPKNL